MALGGKFSLIQMLPDRENDLLVFTERKPNTVNLYLITSVVGCGMKKMYQVMEELE